MPDIDIRLLGDKALERKFNRLSMANQKKVIRKAIREGAKRAKKRIVENIKSDDLIDTGNMLQAFKKTKVKAATSQPRSIIRIGPALPTRAELSIAPDDKYYYPTALEKRFQFMKNAIDKFRQQEYRQLARDIGKGILSLAKR